MYARVRVNGESVILFEECNRRGMPYKNVYFRWAKRGRPVDVDDSLFAPFNTAGRTNHKLVTILPDGEKLTYDQIISEYGMTRTALSKRAKRNNYTLHRDLLERVKKVSENLREHARNRERFEKQGDLTPARVEYGDPAYLPHIKFADLAHLSDEENTGAGKGEIPDDMWIALMHGRRKSIASIGM